MSRPKSGVRIERVKTEQKIYVLLGLATIFLVGGGVFFLSKQQTEQRKIDETPFAGKEMTSEGANHVPEGTGIEYNSNPPHSGPHYAKTAHAGIYDEAPEDGYLVHSLEHGAVILWHKENLPKEDVEKLKEIFKKMPGKTIMTPRKGMDIPVALTSWTRILKLEEIDEKQMLNFYEANYNRGPENVPI